MKITQPKGRYFVQFGLKGIALLLLSQQAVADIIASPTPAVLSLADQVHSIFTANCYHCHGQPGQQVYAGFDYVLDFDKLRASNYIDLVSPEKSTVSNGMRLHDDQIAASVQSNSENFTKKQIREVLALYPEKSVMDDYFQQDRKRFTDAMAQIEGKTTNSIEVVRGTDDHFYEPIDLVRAAGEFNVTPHGLQKRLSNDSDFQQISDELNSGSLDRVTLTSEFISMILGLQLGCMANNDPTTSDDPDACVRQNSPAFN
jgi:hypothetical protein